MGKKIKAFLILAGFLFCMRVDAIQTMQIEKSAQMGLNDCVKVALNNSPMVRRAIINMDVAKSNLGIAKSAYFPSLALQAGYSQRFNSVSGRNSYGNNNTWVLPSFDASLSQLLWNFGKADSNIRMEKFNKIASEYDFDEVVLGTIFDVKLKYYAVLAAKASLEVERLNVQINERNYQRTLAFFEEGLKSRIDLVNAEVNLSDSKVSLVKAEKTYKDSIVTLNNVMYVAYAPEYDIKNTETFNLKNPNVPMGLTQIADYKKLLDLPNGVDEVAFAVSTEKHEALGDYVFQKYPYTFEKSVSIAKENRPDLKALAATVKAMRQYVLLVKKEYLPDLGASVGYSYANNKDYSNSGMNVGVNLITNFNIKQVKHKIDNANSQLNLAKNEVELLNQDMYFSIQKAYIDMIQAEKQIPLLETKVRQTLENLELADGRYSVGLGDYIQLQDARVNYNNAQNSYIKAVYDYNVARATLEREIALPQENTLVVEDVKNYQKDLKKIEKENNQKDKKIKTKNSKKDNV